MDVITAVCTEHQPGILDGWYPIDGGQGVPAFFTVRSIGSASIGGASFFNGDGGGGSGIFRSNDRTTTIGFDDKIPVGYGEICLTLGGHGDGTRTVGFDKEATLGMRDESEFGDEVRYFVG